MVRYGTSIEQRTFRLFVAHFVVVTDAVVVEPFHGVCVAFCLAHDGSRRANDDFRKHRLPSEL